MLDKISGAYNYNCGLTLEGVGFTETLVLEKTVGSQGIKMYICELWVQNALLTLWTIV